MPKITAHGGPTNRFEPAPEPTGDTGIQEAVEPPHAPQVPKPAVNDTKAAWVAYAVSQGWPREDAEGTTKADLVESLKG
ncbi:hypothetical protein [Streptomyces chartreusis]